jgi:hypothetical protein
MVTGNRYEATGFLFPARREHQPWPIRFERTRHPIAN